MYFLMLKNTSFFYSDPAPTQVCCDNEVSAWSPNESCAMRTVLQISRDMHHLD